MKKLLISLLIFACLFSFAGCNTNEGYDILNPYFTAEIVEINQKGYLVEVVDTGNGCFSVGESVQVNIESSKYQGYSVGDKIIISFDGKVALSYPAQISSIYQISKQK